MEGTHLTNSEDRTDPGYVFGTTSTRSVIRYCHPSKLGTIGYCTATKFNEYETMYPIGSLSPGSMIT